MTRDEERYIAACHAMQSAVAYKMNFDKAETEPKHLRVGINSAMVEHAALVGLLIRKGLIERDEHMRVLADAMELEVTSYEQEFGLQPGTFA